MCTCSRGWPSWREERGGKAQVTGGAGSDTTFFFFDLRGLRPLGFSSAFEDASASGADLFARDGVASAATIDLPFALAVRALGSPVFLSSASPALRILLSAGAPG